MIDFHIFPNSEELSRMAAGFIVERARQAVAARGRFTIALSGGSTPRRLLEVLASAPFIDEDFWPNTVVFWGDDRAVGPDHEHSNYRLANETLLRNVQVAKENIFRIKGELGARKAAQVMRNDLSDVFGEGVVPRFDLVLQGMGGDGHTASLFPGTDSLDAVDWVVPVLDPPANPQVDRVTLTFPALNAARTALFLVAGEAKQPLVQTIMSDPEAVDSYPAARVEAEETVWFVDEAAFGL